MMVNLPWFSVRDKPSYIWSMVVTIRSVPADVGAVKLKGEFLAIALIKQ